MAVMCVGVSAQAQDRKDSDMVIWFAKQFEADTEAEYISKVLVGTFRKFDLGIR